MLYSGKLDAHYIVWRTPLANASEFHLYHEI
jgi:hypothetical protein